MTTPVFIRENYDTDAAAKRAYRDAINRLLRDTYSGATAQRPVAPVVAQRYYDTTLGIPIWWNGSAWKNAAGTTV
jgi:hypothetical protein